MLSVGGQPGNRDGRPDHRTCISVMSATVTPHRRMDLWLSAADARSRVWPEPCGRSGMRPLQLPRRRLAAVLVAGATLALIAAFAPVLGEDGENDQPVDFTHNVNDAPAPVAGAVFGTGPALKNGSKI